MPSNFPLLLKTFSLIPFWHLIIHLSQIGYWLTVLHFSCPWLKDILPRASPLRISFGIPREQQTTTLVRSQTAFNHLFRGCDVKFSSTPSLSTHKNEWERARKVDKSCCIKLRTRSQFVSKPPRRTSPSSLSSMCFKLVQDAAAFIVYCCYGGVLHITSH